MTKGSCLCGNIRFEISQMQSNIAHCHCSMCRKFHGSAFATYCTVKLQDFKWICGGELVKTYASSVTAERGFCSHCGSSIFYRLRKPDANYEIALGALDEEPEHRPNANIFWASKAEWLQPLEQLPCFNESRLPKG